MKSVTLHSNLDSCEDAGLLHEGVQRQLTDQELACYAQAAPELAPVFEAIIGNHDLPITAQEAGPGAIRAAGW